MSTLSLVYCKKKDIKLVSFKQKIIIFKIKKQREILWFTCDIRMEIEIFVIFPNSYIFLCALQDILISRFVGVQIISPYC